VWADIKSSGGVVDDDDDDGGLERARRFEVAFEGGKKTGVYKEDMDRC